MLNSLRPSNLPYCKPFIQAISLFHLNGLLKHIKTGPSSTKLLNLNRFSPLSLQAPGGRAITLSLRYGLESTTS